MDITMDIPTKHKRTFDLVNEAVKRIHEQIPKPSKNGLNLLRLKEFKLTKGNLHLVYGVSVIDRVMEA